MKHRLPLLLFIGWALCTATSFSVAAQTGQARVVFFTSPRCGYCHKVKDEDIPPLQSRYGAQLHLFEIDISTSLGRSLFEAAIDFYELPPERRFVPMMILQGDILVGSTEIKAQLDGLVAQCLATGGNDWPAIPGLEAQLAMAFPKAAANPQRPPPFQRDLPGNYVSTALLLVMLPLSVLIVRPIRWQRRLATRLSPWIKIGIALAGLGFAGYLTYTEMSQTEAMCGPIGQCNLVQQSELAVLFGFLPTALLGVLGYLAMLTVYLSGYWYEGPHAAFLPLTGFVLSALGFAFSLVLTYWQPFVIGATCMWCLGSAASMTLSALLNAAPGWAAIDRLRQPAAGNAIGHRP